MTPAELLTRVHQRPLLLDGGLGTVLISMGLPPGTAPERWLTEHPDRIREVHRGYVEAGSDLVHTTTFGANPVKLAAGGLDGRCRELNSLAVSLAREAAGDGVLVAGDVGPTGLFLPPVGEGTEEAMEEAFREQCAALAAAGVDLISIETMYYVREALAAVRAARDSGLAVLCSMTFEPRKRGIFTFMGDPLVASLSSLVEAGATAVGCNCTVTSEAMIAMVEQAHGGLGSVPIVAQPNAGQPITTPSGIRYDAVPEPFAKNLAAMVRAGARLVGGCCGTDAPFVRAARVAIDAVDGG